MMHLGTWKFETIYLQSWPGLYMCVCFYISKGSFLGLINSHELFEDILGDSLQAFSASNWWLTWTLVYIPANRT